MQKVANGSGLNGKIVQRKVGDEMSVTNSRIHSDNKNGMSKCEG